MDKSALIIHKLLKPPKKGQKIKTINSYEIIYPLTKDSCLLCCLPPSPGDSPEPLMGFPIGGRAWSDGWGRSKSSEGAVGEPWVQEELVASLSCTMTGDRLIRLGSELVTGKRGKGTCLLRILIGARYIGLVQIQIFKKKKTLIFGNSHTPEEILVQISWKIRREDKITDRKRGNGEHYTDTPI